MVALPNKNIADTVVAKIMMACADRTNNERRRDYVGMSSLGHPCKRKLWIDYHSPIKPEFNGKTSRIFATGHSREAVIISDLRQAGYKIEGQQLEFSCHDGRCLGHADGIIHGITKRPHLLEIKTSNTASFKSFQKHGIAFNPTYESQMQLYMHFGCLERGLLVVECKENSDLYAERIYYDEKKAVDLIQRAHDIIFDKVAPPKAEDNKRCWLCPWRNNMCDEPPVNRFDLKSCELCHHYITKDVLPQAVDILIKEIKNSVLVGEYGLTFKQDLVALVRSIEDLHPEFVINDQLLNIKGQEDLLKLLDAVLRKYASWVDLPTGNDDAIEIQGLTYSSLRHMMYRLKPAENVYCKLHDNKLIKKPCGCKERKC